RSICFWKPKINQKSMNQSDSKGVEEGQVSIEDGKQCSNETNNFLILDTDQENTGQTKEAAIP
ncbi:hypothetical protein MKX03_015498, partial [Papaver bracteatum]